MNSLLITLALLVWAGPTMMSPMLFASPGALNSASTQGFLALLYSAPAILFGVLAHFGVRYFGFETENLAFGFATASALVLLLMRVPLHLFNIGRGVSNEGYHTTGDRVYFDGWRVKKACARHFRVLHAFYACDDRTVFYSGRPLAGADVTSFAPLTQGESARETGYWRDHSAVFWRGRMVKEAEAASFTPLGSMYSKDRHQVYYDLKPLPGARPDSFATMEADSSLARDDLRAYYLGRPIEAQGEVLNPKQLRQLSASPHGCPRFFLDERHVFAYTFRGPVSLLPGADAASFEMINNIYAKDRTQVFQFDADRRRITVLPGQNPDSFTPPP